MPTVSLPRSRITVSSDDGWSLETTPPNAIKVYHDGRVEIRGKGVISKSRARSTTTMGAPQFLTKAKAKKIKKKKDEWLCGYACALASVARLRQGGPHQRSGCSIREILERDAIDLDELKAADVEEDDLAVIVQALL